MKKTFLLAGIVVCVLCMGMGAHAQQPAQSPVPAPILPPPPKPRELMERMRELMMQTSGESSEASRQCHMLMRTSLFLDSPAALRGQAEFLGLSTDQIQKLAEIETEARSKAKSVLKEEQISKLGAVPDKAVAMMDVCPRGFMLNLEQMLEKFISGQGAPEKPGIKPE
ncbi:MAG TPA: hypothetical protein VK463_17285 [Desulfomonilaceae bacterium]|nr:hypothetical protein [Desulfomonilaceae bacterium]